MKFVTEHTKTKNGKVHRTKRVVVPKHLRTAYCLARIGNPVPSDIADELLPYMKYKNPILYDE